MPAITYYETLSKRVAARSKRVGGIDQLDAEVVQALDALVEEIRELRVKLSDASWSTPAGKDSASYG